VVGWAERARWAGREAETQWGGGKRSMEKKKRWAAARPKGRMGRKRRKNSFSNKNLIFEYTKALKICTRRFRRNFDMRIFLNSSRLLKYFRKMKYAMPCYATLGKIN
jgi:hypothetical protein